MTDTILLNPIVGLDPHPNLIVLGLFHDDPSDFNRLKLFKSFSIKPIVAEIEAVHREIVSYTLTNNYTIISEDENGTGKLPCNTFLELGANVYKIASHYTNSQKQSNSHRDKSDILDCQYLVQAFKAGAKYKQLKLDLIQSNWLDLRKEVNHRQWLVGKRTSLKCKINFLLYDLFGCEYKTTFEGEKWGAKWIKQVKESLGLNTRGLALHTLNLFKEIESYDEKIKAIEGKLKGHAFEDAKRLMQIPGVGEIIGVQLAVILNSITPPKTRSSLQRFAGVAPVFASSANSNEKHCDHRGKGLLNHLVHLAVRMAIMTKKEDYRYVKKKVGDKKDAKTKNDALRKLKYFKLRRIYSIYYK